MEQVRPTGGLLVADDVVQIWMYRQEHNHRPHWWPGTTDDTKRGEDAQRVAEVPELWGAMLADLLGAGSRSGVRLLVAGDRRARIPPGAVARLRREGDAGGRRAHLADRRGRVRRAPRGCVDAVFDDGGAQRAPAGSRFGDRGGGGATPCRPKLLDFQPATQETRQPGKQSPVTKHNEAYYDGAANCISYQIAVEICVRLKTCFLFLIGLHPDSQALQPWSESMR